jgi:hypothetical protein
MFGRDSPILAPSFASQFSTGHSAPAKLRGTTHRPQHLPRLTPQPRDCGPASPLSFADNACLARERTQVPISFKRAIVLLSSWTLPIDFLIHSDRFRARRNNAV